MLKLGSVNERDDIEQQSGLHQKGDFKHELRELESLIANLITTQKSPVKKNDSRKNGNHSKGFQKLRIRRMSKKIVASANVGETKEDFIKRVKKLQCICVDLTERLNADEDDVNNGTADSAVDSSKMESRDDGMMSTERENDEVERRVAEDRADLLQAIATCANVLSKLSIDPEMSNRAMGNFELPADEIKMKDLTENAEQSFDGIEITESKFLETGENEDVAEPSDDIALTESKSMEVTNAFMCCDMNDFNMIEAIANLLRSIVFYGDEEKEEEQANCVNPEEKETQDCFCFISQLWNVTQDGSLEEKEAFANSIESTGTTECRTNPTEQLKNTSESSAEDPKIETLPPTSPQLYTICPSDEDPETSLGCGAFESLCSVKKTTTDTDAPKNSEDEEVGRSLVCGFSSLDLLPLPNIDDTEISLDRGLNDETSSKQDLDPLETAEHCMTTVTSMDAIRECVVAGLGASECSKNDSQVEGKEELASEREINTISSMDFIPRIEVVGFKSSNNSAMDDKNSAIQTTDLMNNAETEESTKQLQELEDEPPVSSMDFIEVVGFKTNESIDLKDEKQLQRKDKAVMKQRGLKWKVSSSKKSGTQKMSQKEYRRTTAKERRKQRKLKHTSKKDHNSNGLHLGTIQEAPEHLEQSSNDSANATKEIETRGNAMHRDTPGTLDEKPADELPPPSVGHQCNAGRSTPEENNDQAPFNEHELLDTVTSSLSTWTDNKSAFKDVNVREREDRNDNDDYENRKKKKPWFFERLIEEKHDDIVECMSPVLSMPAASSFGTRYGDNEDDEYVNHYYDFEDDDGNRTNPPYEYADDYKYDYDNEYEYEEEDEEVVVEEEEGQKEESDCYSCNSYEENYAVYGK